MNIQPLTFPRFSILAIEPWQEVTNSVRDDNPPFTIAKPNGVGALQFSHAQYKAGAVPNATIDDLVEMVHSFAESHDLRQGFAPSRITGEPFGAGESFRDGGQFIRVWYMSDGKSFLLATYVCDWDVRNFETDDCELMVRSATFL